MSGDGDEKGFKSTIDGMRKINYYYLSNINRYIFFFYKYFFKKHGLLFLSPNWPIEKNQLKQKFHALV